MNCGMCGRLLDLTAKPPDPAVDCGGDCWGCIESVEAKLADQIGSVAEHLADNSVSRSSKEIEAPDLRPPKRMTPDGTEW